MEMAKYIMSILKTQLMVVWSWGFHKPIALENGLRFNVQGFKFRGVVSIDGVFFDSLVEVIDDYVEKTTDYEKRVTAQYSISL